MIWLAVAIAFLVAAILTGAVRALALRTGLLDEPNQRSSHSVAVPRGGGLAIVLVTLAVLAWGVSSGLIGPRIALGVGGGGGLIALLGWLDDRHGLSPALRLGVQAVAALWFAFWCADPLATLDSSAGQAASFLWRTLAFVALLWAVNLFNFMDGIDGLAAGQGVYMAGIAAFLAGQAGGAAGAGDLLAILAAASAGFLVWNVSRARIFMGDVGSCFLGFMLAATMFLVSASSTIPLATWVIVAGVFLVDATVTLVLRLFRGENLATAHRSHLYQRLAIAWGSHLRVTALYLAINLLWLAPLAAWSASAPDAALWITFLALGPLILVCMKLRDFGRL